MTDKMIWLLRHAKADTADSNMEDIDRPLSHHGRQQATRLGEWMQQQGVRPGFVISSPAVRARQTTELVFRSLGVDMNTVYFDPALYIASRRDLLEIIDKQSASAESIMLVGHNPGLEELLIWLCKEPLPRTTDGKLLKPASLAGIRLTGAPPGEGSGSLVDLIRADELA